MSVVDPEGVCRVQSNPLELQQTSGCNHATPYKLSHCKFNNPELLLIILVLILLR